MVANCFRGYHLNITPTGFELCALDMDVSEGSMAGTPLEPVLDAANSPAAERTSMVVRSCTSSARGRCVEVCSIGTTLAAATLTVWQDESLNGHTSYSE